MVALTARSPKSTQMFCAAIFLISILGYFSGAAGVFAAEAHQPFAAFNAMLDIDIEDGEIEVEATFTLSENSNGLNVAAEAVSLQVLGGTGAYFVTIPAGSFKTDRSGRFTFQGTINKVKIAVLIRPLRSGIFELEAVFERANLRGMANPVTVSLTIGDDGGTRSVRAKIE